MQIVRPGGTHGKALVEALNEPWQEVVSGLDAADIGQTQLLYETILQRSVGSLNATLGLAGVSAQDLDV